MEEPQITVGILSGKEIEFSFPEIGAQELIKS